MLAHALIHSLRQRNRPAVAPPRQSLDLTDENSLQQALAANRPSLLLNCAAYTKVDKAEEEPALAHAVNGHALESLVALCRQYHTKLVHFSTDFVFDGKSTHPYQPTDPTAPQSVYGFSKLLGEQHALKHPNSLVIRTAWLYGPGGPSFPRTMVELARAKKPLTVVNDQTGSPTFTNDLADATLRLLDATASGIFHVVNPGSVSWFNFAKAILEEFGEETQLAPITSGEWKAKKPNSATRPAYSVLDVSHNQQTT